MIHPALVLEFDEAAGKALERLRTAGSDSRVVVRRRTADGDVFYVLRVREARTALEGIAPDRTVGEALRLDARSPAPARERDEPEPGTPMEFRGVVLRGGSVAGVAEPDPAPAGVVPSEPAAGSAPKRPVRKRRRHRPSKRADRSGGAPPKGAASPGAGAGEAPPVGRYVNLCFSGEEGRTVPSGLDLAANRSYRLRIDIGERSQASIVADPLPVRSELLPASPEGHWLEVVAVSDDLLIATEKRHLFLPRTGPGWVCRCPVDGAHHCTPEDRDDHLDIPVRTPDRPGPAAVRVALYHHRNLVQSLRVTLAVAETERDGRGQSAVIDYNLTAALADVDALPPRAVHVLTNRNDDGTHRIVVNGDGDRVLAFSLSELQMRNAIDASRAVLRDVHIREGKATFGRTRRETLLDDDNGKGKDDFLSDLERLAPLGWTLWTSLGGPDPEQRARMRAWLGGSAGTVQVSRVHGASFVFPWALVYDIPLASDERVPCPILERWSANGRAEDLPDTCPHEADHALNTLCPFGFWGFRHVIEQPASTPQGRPLPTAIRVRDDIIDLVIGTSTNLLADLRKAHLDALRARLGPLRTRHTNSVGELKTLLGEAALEMVYFYCHGRRKPVPGGGTATPWIEFTETDGIAPDDIYAWVEGLWPRDHWRETGPLVFINGCHTAELTPEMLVNFVDSFSSAYASGVIGTEITLHQRVANEAAEQILADVAAGRTVGSAVRRLRLRFLGKGNLLGLVYTPYCSAELRLDRAVPVPPTGG